MSIKEYVRQVVDQAPPLTFDQANRIAALLRPGASKDLTPPPDTTTPGNPPTKQPPATHTTTTRSGK